MSELQISSTDARERGRQRGRALASSIEQTWSSYTAFFDSLAPRRNQVERAHEVGLACLEATRSWSHDLAAEVEGVAEGSGIPLASVAALNARTEVLATIDLTEAECSAVGRAGIGIQTWDWYDALAHTWHTQRVEGDRQTFVGLTEHGILAKSGMNSAGVGTLFNILSHRDSVTAAPGVPVHLVARRVLGEAASLAEAEEIARSARVSAATVLTVIAQDGACCLELSPGGVARLDAPIVIHTNHFRDTELVRSEFCRPEQLDDSVARCAGLETVADRLAEAADPDALRTLMAMHEPAAICRHDVLSSTGELVSTLATVAMLADRRQAWVAAGPPCQRAAWQILDAG